jgi:hypothetical protein
MPAGLLAPRACRRLYEAAAPRLRLAARLALRALRAPPPVLRAALPATPGVSPPAGAREAPASAASPTAAGPVALPQPRGGTAAPRPAPAVSRAPRPTAPPRQLQGPARGGEPGAPRGPRALATGRPTSRAARPRAITSAPSPRARGGTRPAPRRPAGWAVPRVSCGRRPEGDGTPRASRRRPPAGGRVCRACRSGLRRRRRPAGAPHPRLASSPRGRCLDGARAPRRCGPR